MVHFEERTLIHQGSLVSKSIEELRRLGLGHLCTKTYQARVRILPMKGSPYSVIKVLFPVVKEQNAQVC